MRRLRALTVVPVIGAVILSGTGAADGYSVPGIPSGTTGVTVHAGAITPNINAAIKPGAAIAGKVTSAANGAALSNVYVQVYTAAGGYVAGTSTVNDGTYKIVSLPPSSTGFYVCTNGDNATGGPSSYGYVHRCYGSSAVWNNSKPPSSAHKVPTVGGVTKTNINVALTSAGAITGKTTATNGATLSSVPVEVFSTAGQIVASIYSYSSTYQIKSIPPGKYKVCFAATTATGGPSKSGYLSECWNNKAWNGSSKPPSGSATVQVTAGHQKSGISAALSAAGAIAGTVRTASSPHKALQYSSVYAFSGTSIVGYGSSLANGSFTLRGLRAGSYKVCATGGYVAHSTVPYTKGQCWKGQAWSAGRPSAHATALSVKLGKTHTGVNLLMGRGSNPVGAIAGTVKSSSGKLLKNVSVTVYSSSVSYLASVSTTAKGTYKVPNLRATSTGYFVCFGGGNASPSSGAAPSNGYTNVCYKQVKWDLGAVPSHTTRVSVKAGKTHGGINATLGAGGAISGQVKFGSTPLSYLSVYVLNPHKQLIMSGYTDSNGLYSVKSLTPESGYIVCFPARNSFGATVSPTGFRSQCYKNKAWDSPTQA